MPAANPDTYTGRPGRPVHAGKTDPLASAPPPPPPPPPPGPGTTLTTVSLDSRASADTTLVPVTFGQPFAAGHWNPATHNLFARVGADAVPVQADDIALHVDGSVRFAVLSAEIPAFAAGETKNVELYTSTDAPQAAPALAVPADWNPTIDLRQHFPQTLRVKFVESSTAFWAVGDTATITLTYGEVVETYTVTVTAAMLQGVGPGSISAMTRISHGLRAAMANSPTFFAYKIGYGDDYGNVRIRLRDVTQPGSFTITMSQTGAGAPLMLYNVADYGGLPVDYTANLRAALLNAVAESNGGTASPARRMHGRVASEFLLTLPLILTGGSAVHPHLHLRAAVRLYRGGAVIKTDVIYELTNSFTPDQRQQHYSTVIRNGATQLHYQQPMTHFYGSRWRKTLWHGAQPNVRVRHAMRYFIDSKITYSYDLGLTINESAIAANLNDLNAARATQIPTWGPMSHLNLQPLMGTTGGRPDIGPAPKWHVTYLLTQDDRALEVMLANADAAAAATMHYRDENTGRIIDIETYPRITLNLASNPSPRIPDRVDQTPWAPDLEHQVGFCFIPYLITGDHFYLEEVQFWVSFTMLYMNNGYRGLERGLLYHLPIRAEAWTLRNVFDAARVTPENHPLKAYHKRLLANNLQWYADNYRADTTNPEISPFYTMRHNAPDTSPWQMDFFTIVIANIAQNNEPNAQAMLDWITNFTVGRVLAEPDGFPTARVPGYYWRTKTRTDEVWITGWAQLFEICYPNDVGKDFSTLTIIDGQPDGPYGYCAILRACLGEAARAGVPGAATAYARWKSFTPKMDATMRSTPTWAIVPPTT